MLTLTALPLPHSADVIASCWFAPQAMRFAVIFNDSRNTNVVVEPFTGLATESGMHAYCTTPRLPAQENKLEMAQLP
jgi:hypothetical protein